MSRMDCLEGNMFLLFLSRQFLLKLPDLLYGEVYQEELLSKVNLFRLSR